MNHTKAGCLVRKDQAKRLKYQEAQRVEQKMLNNQPVNKFWATAKLSEGQMKSFVSKLVK